LTKGEIDYTGISISEIVSFKRKFNDQEELVLHNVSDVEVTVKLPGENEKFDKAVYQSNPGVKIQRGEITLPAYCTLILK
jgi:hypothetical protein